ncbi:bifunctional DNA primase/polymerase [Streptomyces zingiberis]|uniref:bifunctional DNA primase/polymerase n=1 Tax=Streptomyces zingiberis TaxID=2053010 RepID=UPI0019D1E64E|nr:bifunctional DNA primase/polymerase [Streptomyces zingiberis]
MERVTRLGVQWLAVAADDGIACQATWADNPREPYLLAVGRIFEVVVIDERAGLETFDQLRRTNLPVGPVMADWASHQVGFFLPPRSEKQFANLVHCESARHNCPPPAYKYLAYGSHIVVPGPMMLSGDRFQWLRAPGKRSKRGYLRCASLAAMFVAASSLLASADRYNESAHDPAEAETLAAGVSRV